MRPTEAPVHSTTNRLRRSSPALNDGSSSLSAARLRLRAALSSRDIWRNASSLITAAHPQRGGDRVFPVAHDDNAARAAGKLACYGTGLGLEPAPQVLLHPSVTGRFTAHAPGLSAPAARPLRPNPRSLAAGCSPAAAAREGTTSATR